MYKIILAAFVSLLFFYSSTAQGITDKDELQKQRLQLKKEIEETEKILNETRSTTKANMGDLITINKRINLQDNVIENITGQLRYIENDIYKSQRDVNKLSKVLDTLKQEYAKSMVYAYKTRNNYDFLNFIFSASSFNDAIKRITYLKSYRTYRELQGENIFRTQSLLQQRINELSGNKQQKNIALQEKSKEMSELEKQQKEKQNIVNKLKGRQKELATQINNKKKQDAKLRSLITIMIKREIEIARKKAAAEAKERERLAGLNKPKTNPDTKANNIPTKPAAKPARTTGSLLVSSEADRVLDASFERNRGSLPWPVNGFVLIHYGPYTIPDTKIRGENPGVTIGTQVGNPVKAVFEGEVTLVTYMDDKQVVFIKHGKYFTVYSNLSSVNVQRGQKVKTSEVIGRAGANDDGQGEVLLILMKENNNVNPELWLHK
ncbi:MAG: peptidoglycan DD-metalloendopeptidase family protein [Ginsengibacter sp.]